MDEKSKQETCTYYEVYNKKTGYAIRSITSGKPCRLEYLTNARLLIVAAQNEADELHPDTVESFRIPSGAELDVRPVAVLKYHADLSLSDALETLGYTCTDYPNSLGKRHITKNGVVYCTGNCTEVWAWLRRTGQLVDPPPHRYREEV